MRRIIDLRRVGLRERGACRSGHEPPPLEQSPENSTPRDAHGLWQLTKFIWKILTLKLNSWTILFKTLVEYDVNYFWEVDCRFTKREWLSFWEIFDFHFGKILKLSFWGNLKTFILGKSQNFQFRKILKLRTFNLGKPQNF